MASQSNHAHDIVLGSKGEAMPADAPQCQGYDFEGPMDYDALFKSYLGLGFQGTEFARALEEINKMITWRLSDDPVAEGEEEEFKDPDVRRKIRGKIFLGYTSNMISCGVREIIKYLCKHKMVDCIVTTGGGIEEDFMKCMAPHFLGDFRLKGSVLRKQGLNRIGNLLVPNDTYCKLEDWIVPILDKMLEEQKEQGVVWTPSKMINRLGKEINNEDSVYYWCWKNNIPVYSPAITDGAIGDNIFFHSYKNEGLVLDIASDVRNMNKEAMNCRHTGCLILGGGLVKHHIMNANLMRNGTDHAVFINSAQHWEGSDSGANPEEAISWGKIRMTSEPIKIYGDATLLFPLVVAQTFKKHEASFLDK